MKPQPDEGALSRLMQAAQAGDVRAYVQLLEAITPRLRRMVRGRRGFLSEEDVEDLVQEILLSLHAVRATWDPQRPFMPWLAAIARNRMADGARRYARGRMHEVAVESLPVTFSDDTAKIGQGAYRDPEALLQAIRGLPAGQRDAIEMLKLRGMSLKEAAAATGTSVGALKVAVHRAIGALRKSLGNES
jgi:RNA polymerase sigma-70 factor (ECF subfamily)